MSSRQLIDAAVLGGLLLVLLVVVLVDKLAPTAPQAPGLVIAQPASQAIVLNPVRAKPLRLAVTRSYQDKHVGVWDDMAKLLATLGEGYRFRLIETRELDVPKRFEDFDVLFLTCAPGGTEPAVTENLRGFVGGGGTLYASDWRYDAVAAAFPDVVARNLRHDGSAQSLDARVVDPGLRDLIGPTVPLKFDLDKWKPAAFGGDRVKVLLEGTYQRQTRGIATAPLLVKFAFGKGTVIFTSFHNEKQNSEIEQKLLKYLVFSAVTAQLDAQINQSIIQGGFTPQKQNLLSASPGAPQVSYAYKSAKAGKIAFVLGFDDRGARLRLTVKTPDGKTIEREGTSSFSVEAASPGPADWQYTVTAAALPFPEFPFTVTVAESDP